MSGPEDADTYPHTAQHIHIERAGPTRRIWIDGTPFPWITSRDDLEVDVNPDRMPAVRLTIYADKVTVSNRLNEGSMDKEDGS